jgi:hypothetical protein
LPLWKPEVEKSGVAMVSVVCLTLRITVINMKMVQIGRRVLTKYVKQVLPKSQI